MLHWRVLVGLKASGLTWSAGGSRSLTALVVSFGRGGTRSFRVAVVAGHDIETLSGRQVVKSLSLSLSLVMDAYSGRPSGAGRGPARPS